MMRKGAFACCYSCHFVVCKKEEGVQVEVMSL